MPTPASRTPVRVARGTYANLAASLADLQEGEICYATDQNKLYAVEGGVLTTAGGGSSVTASDTAPSSPNAGDLWYDSTGGRLYVYYNDGTSSQWVDAAPQGGGTALIRGNTSAEVIDTGGDGRFVVTTEGAEALRVDASRRLLVGTSSARSNFFGNSTAFQIEATNPFLSGISVLSNRSTADANWPAFLRLGRSGSTDIGSNTLVASGNRVGSINFCGADGANLLDAAAIYVEIDGTPGANSMPGRIVLSTTAAGAGSPTERMGISSTGAVTCTGTISDAAGDVRSIPQNAQTAAYSLAATDNGKHISITTGGVTVPSGVFSVGQAVTIFNNSASNQTLTQGTSVTLRQGGTANTGNRTLAQYGLATILCVASNTFVITGTGLT